ncbi:MAG: TIGR03862 family flavoprotein [Rhodocyclaceae bacterium]|nr:MAG: TIGR03862 family flavoprotein [Rhodocyclaceae bacterium]
MAAEVLARQGLAVMVFDAMPSVGRKFLMAGKGGMNITHSEPRAPFVARYGDRAATIAPLLDEFGPEALQAWIQGLGIETFVGSSGRVFPTEMKAAPLLRAWLHRLRQMGVGFHVRHRWLGWGDDGSLCFATTAGEVRHRPAATVLALGGGSWPRLGSDGAWVSLLADKGIAVAPLRPANCGFDVAWSPHLLERCAGEPVKSVVASCTDEAGVVHVRQGECVITDNGLEGGLVYALSAYLREAIARRGYALLTLDLLPGRSLQWVQGEVARPRGSRSMASHLQSRLNITGVKAALLRECVSREDFADPVRLAAAIKALPISLAAPRPMAEAISTAGGVAFEELDGSLMVKGLPGVFCAGEMLDWEAPTGGYLLTACFATGHAAGQGVLRWLSNR